MKKSAIRWRSVAWILMVVVVVPYCCILGWLKWNEAELVFLASMSHAPVAWADLPPQVARVDIPLPGRSPLHGLALEPDISRDRGFWILHLHGNADSAFSQGQIAHAMLLRDQGFHLLAFDYRGFGDSQGEATEANTYEDAEAAYQWLIKQGVQPEKIILWGHSLGSGPAVELATRHTLAALVLFGAFTSVPDRAAELYPWLPVRWVAGIHFDNLNRMPEVRAPVVIVHATTDQTTPFAHASRLYQAAKEPKRLITLQPLSDGNYGGHFEAAYEHLDVVMAAVEQLVPAMGKSGSLL